MLRAKNLHSTLSKVASAPLHHVYLLTSSGSLLCRAVAPPPPGPPPASFAASSPVPENHLETLAPRCKHEDPNVKQLIAATVSLHVLSRSPSTSHLPTLLSLCQSKVKSLNLLLSQS
eukprot:CAMPEP_0197551332 /NCGR_PEP_ID=MMETSP1320-20131121/4636_1 /TAXON_ID=91990 /ORGANISM="Bolidomonas sp., Strain RCC2347" /LENGTH=116 /DNA_ID=CAMNT_0043111815 /DNA_START=181 /DNA_END=527 /DNA_ORIENTATION=-